MSSRSSSSLFWSIFALAAVALFFVGISVVKELLLPALQRQPETFTELYFEDHLRLPKKTLFNAPATISATIHNLEGKTTVYPIEVVAQNDQDPPVIFPLLTKTVSLKHREIQAFPIEFTIPSTASMSGRTKIIVSLKNIDQSIHFWIEVPKISTESVKKTPIIRHKKAN